MTTNEWDKYAADWDGNEDVRRYAEEAFNSWTTTIAPLVSHLPQCRILDFGCGTGLLTEKIAPLCREIVAVDPSPKMVDVLRKKINDKKLQNIVALNTTVTSDSVSTEPCFKDKFDVVVASSVCSFLPDYAATLCAITDLMKPGAVFVQWDWLAEMPPEKIQSAFAQAGLIEHHLGEAFVMTSDDEAMPVVMGVGRLSS